MARFNIKTYLDSLSPDELKTHLETSNLKRKATFKAKKHRLDAARKQAEEMLPEIIASDILQSDNENYTPRRETVEKLREIMGSGVSMEEMRKKHFKYTSDKGWEKLTKFLFKDHVAHIEDLGLELLTIKRDAIEQLEKNIRTIEKEIKIDRKIQKSKNVKHIRTPMSLLQMLQKAQRELLAIRMDLGKALHSVGAVGSKSKGSASIHFHTNTPRPAPKEVKEVSKVILGELVTD